MSIAVPFDEFEQISLRKFLLQDSQDYLVTLKRLIDISEEGDLAVLAMTPDAAEQTARLIRRFGIGATLQIRPHREDAGIDRGARACRCLREHVERLHRRVAAHHYQEPRRIVKVLHAAVGQRQNWKASEQTGSAESTGRSGRLSVTANDNQQPDSIPAPVVFSDTNAVHYATLRLRLDRSIFDVPRRART
jgi:hypothetical protein